MSDGPGDVPDDAGDSGVQRVLGERRLRRLAERAGQVDLDATMSHWPVTDPPTEPRTVVRPARPTLDGVATEPVVPPPGQLVIGPLLQARQAETGTGSQAPVVGSRRSRRRAEAAPADPDATSVLPGTGGDRSVDAGTPSRGSTDVSPGAAPGAAPDASTSVLSPTPGASSGPPLVPTPTVTPTSTATPTPTATPTAEPARDVTAARGSTGLRGHVSWPPGPREAVLAAVALMVLLLVVLLLVQLLGGDDGAEARPQRTGVTAQQTLATVAAPDGAVVAAALLGVDAARVSTLLLPTDLLLVVADGGDATLAQAVVLGPDAVRRGLEDTLQLRVDATLAVQPGQLARLVDAVLQVEGEPAEAGLARFGDVLSALLAAMPTEADDAADTLAAADVAATTGQAEEVAAVVAASARRSAAGDTEALVLPTGLSAGHTDRRALAEAEADPVLDDRFAGARLPVAALGEVRVVVRNGVGKAGLVGRARDRLVEAGLRYAGGANAVQLGQASTLVLVASQDADARAQGVAVASAPGVPDDALQVNSEAMVDTDVVVVLSEDFADAAGGDPAGSTEPTPGDLP